MYSISSDELEAIINHQAAANEACLEAKAIDKLSFNHIDLESAFASMLDDDEQVADATDTNADRLFFTTIWRDFLENQPL